MSTDAIRARLVRAASALHISPSQKSDTTAGNPLMADWARDTEPTRMKGKTCGPKDAGRWC